MIGKTLQMTVRLATVMFLFGAADSAFKHYYKRFADQEDMNDGTITQVSIVSDETKNSRGRKK